jgi:hypothetical protein
MGAIAAELASASTVGATLRIGDERRISIGRRVRRSIGVAGAAVWGKRKRALAQTPGHRWWVLEWS